ncbi:MAG: hypothetical protein FWH34_04710 [Desulfovibrionaceae bacterium]|nr:hypothetical protein [Desulfovibrionaceae bacterium]
MKLSIQNRKTTSIAKLNTLSLGGLTKKAFKTGYTTVYSYLRSPLVASMLAALMLGTLFAVLLHPRGGRELQKNAFAVTQKFFNDWDTRQRERISQGFVYSSSASREAYYPGISMPEHPEGGFIIRCDEEKIGAIWRSARIGVTPGKEYAAVFHVAPLQGATLAVQAIDNDGQILAQGTLSEAQRVTLLFTPAVQFLTLRIVLNKGQSQNGPLDIAWVRSIQLSDLGAAEATQ